MAVKSSVKCIQLHINTNHEQSAGFEKCENKNHFYPDIGYEHFLLFPCLKNCMHSFNFSYGTKVKAQF